MELEGNSNAGTSAAFLEQLRQRYAGTGGLRVVNLPGYSPDFNADEAIWGWVREEGTGNLCLGIREAVQEMVGGFLSGLANRKDGVKQRCRRCCNQGSKHICETRGPIPSARQMHIPPWLWFGTARQAPTGRGCHHGVRLRHRQYRTTYTDTGIGLETRHMYRVEVRNSHGFSSWSNFVRIDK